GGCAPVWAARVGGGPAGDHRASAAGESNSTSAPAVVGKSSSASPTSQQITDEGAVPEPHQDSLPSDEVSRASNSRFTMPLKDWSKVTDRYGARNRGAGLIHGGIDLALDGLSHSNVYSACTGTVADASYNYSY